MPKIKEKNKAIILRKKGFSYSEILKEIPIAKSTLSLWLRDVGLSKKQKQKLTEKKLAAMKRGWEACHQKRLKITELIKYEAKREIKSITRKDLWLIGTALYWAEGSKEKLKGTRLDFVNSDPLMVRLFLKWLRKIMKIPEDDIRLSIYLHENNRERKKEVQSYWSQITGFSIANLQSIVWKKHNIKTNRKNIGKSYFGLLRVTVLKSTNLNRKTAGWIEGICQRAL
jgi:hypothetical protein